LGVVQKRDLVSCWGSVQENSVLLVRYTCAICGMHAPLALLLFAALNPNLAAAEAQALPSGPISFACTANALAYNFSLALQPTREPATFAKLLAEALNATSCGGFARPPLPPSPAATTPAPTPLHILVDPSGALPGSVPTVAAALAALRQRRSSLPSPVAATIELTPGAHRVGAGGLLLSAQDSFTVITGPAGPAGAGPGAWLTGAAPLPAATRWLPHNVTGGANVWAADIGGWLGGVELVGLRVAGARATRARYPNADPERDGFGSSLRAEAWLPPAALGSAAQFSPPEPFRNITGNYTRFALGVGGACSVFSPPASLWCSTERTQSGGDAPFQLPTGLVASLSTLPHAPYAQPATAIVHAFRPSRWESYMYQVNGSDSGSPGLVTLSFGGGGFQGARGSAVGEAFYVENVAEELDAPGEWYYSRATGVLYLWHNASSGTPPPPCQPNTPGTGVEAPLARVLVNITGTPAAPVRNVTLQGIGLRDSRYTFMDAHAVPSGGDWALARSAALYAEGTEGLVVAGCAFSRLDGSALMAYGHHRGLRVEGCEFSWVGESGVVLWGETAGAEGAGVAGDGPDGTAMRQPWGSALEGNLFRELGIYEKQSAAVFQAKAGATRMARNIAFNLPRAAFLVNDGFGGGTVVWGNVAFNTCRETGPPADHGPVNFWDRQAYFWMDRGGGWVDGGGMDGRGTPTSTKQPDLVARNLLIGNYWTSTVVDGDDGTRFLSVTDNVLVGGTLGAKQPFAGAQLLFARNLHAYVGLGYHLYHPPDAGWAFVNATLVQLSDGDYGQKTVCGVGGQGTSLGGSLVATPGANVTECGMGLQAWQRESGMDAGTRAALWPSNEELAAAAWALLAPVLA
jgi:hypothetical protein